MKTIRAITIILLLLSFTHVCGQDNLADSPVSSLPSDETYQTIEESSSVPNLRYGPGEWGNANKESPMPLGRADLLSLLLLGAGLSVYTRIRGELKKNKY